MSQKPLKANKTITHEPLLLLRKLAACSDSPLSARMRRVTSWRDYDTVSATFNPRNYSDLPSLRHDYLCVELLRKFADISSDIRNLDLDVPAYEAFHRTEDYMSTVNERLNLANKVSHPHKSAGEASISMARLKILRLLGASPCLEELENHCGFSSGASFCKRRSDGSTAMHKFDSVQPEVTPGCLNLAKTIVSRSTLWSKTVRNFNIVRGNRITTVPKNRKTNRTIAIEPQMNMYIQKGIGGMIRSRLAKAGVDLNDQSINQEYARQGSIDGYLATIDLTAASDSVSIELVRALLPPDWYFLLMETRSEEGLLNDKWITYNKISSMGNGYTFELESLIFWALTKSVVDEDDVVNVYGDDIVAPSHHLPAIQEVFDYVGFELNMSKSFWTGSFRESCGKHYFNGRDVSPIYHKSNGKPGNEQTLQLILLANNLRRLIGRTYEVQYAPVYHWIVQHLPETWQKPRIPDGVGDGALIGTLHECDPHFGYYRTTHLGKRENSSHPGGSSLDPIVGPCFHAKVLNKVAVKPKDKTFPLRGALTFSLKSDCVDPDELERQRHQRYRRRRQLFVDFQNGVPLNRSLTKSEIRAFNKAPDQQYEIVDVRCKISKGNLRIWGWSDPAW